MNLTEFKARLAEKITSREQFDALMAHINGEALHTGRRVSSPLGESKIVHDYSFTAQRLAQLRADTTVGVNCFVPGTEPQRLVHLPYSEISYDNNSGWTIHGSRWWLVRDWLRIRLGIYPMTETLTALTNTAPMAHFAVHCAVEGDDRNMVAYTPDPEYGEADRKRRTTLSRLLRQLYPASPEDYLRDVEARHRAEMTNELEMVTGEAIIDAYLAGPSSCMAKQLSSFGTPVHPLKVYDAPGWALAVLRNGSGEVSARALTWTNPADPADKRYVRVYGDGALTRRLHRNGFRMHGWAGARLRQIRLPEFWVRKQLGSDYCDQSRYGTFLTSYLDNPSDGSGRGAVAGAAFDGDEWIALIDSDTYHKVRARGLFPFGVSTATGYVTVSMPKAMRMQELEFTCPVTGRAGRLGDSTVLVVHEGTIRRALEAPAGSRIVFAVFEESMCEVYAPEGTPTFTIPGATGAYLDNNETRAARSFVRLSARWYADSPWVPKRDAVVTSSTAGGSSPSYIRAEDAVHVITLVEGKAVLRATHASEVSKDFKSCTRVKVDRPCFVHKDVPVVKTVSGRNAVAEVHNVVELFDGRWAFDGNTVSFDMLGRTAFRLRGDAHPTTLPPQMQRLMSDAVAEAQREYFDERAMARFREQLAATPDAARHDVHTCFFFAMWDSLCMSRVSLSEGGTTPVVLFTYLYNDRDKVSAARDTIAFLTADDFDERVAGVRATATSVSAANARWLLALDAARLLRPLALQVAQLLNPTGAQQDTPAPTGAQQDTPAPAAAQEETRCDDERFVIAA